MTVGKGLFGADSDSPTADKRGKRKGEDEAIEKRIKLRRYDQVGPQLLQVADVSAIHECSKKKLWKWAKEGGYKVEFHSEWCSEDPYRRGVALSRLAEVLLAVGVAMTHPTWDKVLLPAILKTVREEFEKHKEHLEVLHGGKTQNKKGGLLKAKKETVEHKDEEKVKKAAQDIYDWLSEEHSPTEGFLQVLSWGGVFYAAMCADKITRAAINPTVGDIKKEDFVKAAIARLSSDKKEESDDEGQPLSKGVQSLLKEK